MLRIKARKQLRDYRLEVDIAVGTGETLVLMGCNGSGKTTVLNMAAGIASPDEGLIEVGGRVLFDSARGLDVPPEDRNIGYVFQNYALFPHMSVFDNVAFGLRMKKQPKEEVGQRVREELESVGMWALQGVKAAKLSGGQKQKVALARGLVIKPSLLLLDEPLSALDAGMHTSIRESLKSRLKTDRIPVVIALHNIKDALEIGDQVCIMDQGHVVLAGKPSEIFNKGQNQYIDNLFC